MFCAAIWHYLLPYFRASLQSPVELIEMAHKYYEETALPKLVKLLPFLSMRIRFHRKDLYHLPLV